LIEEIYIQDLGIIAESRLKFGSGLTVITGETGAGKTMVLSALALLLGSRSDTSAIRQGQPQAFVEGRWWLKNPELLNSRLDDAGVGATEGELILNRAVSVEGRSRASVSARSVPVSLLSEIGDQLVVVHGQSDQIRLRSTSAAREALDQFAGQAHLSRLAEYRARFNEWREQSARLTELKQNLGSKASRIEELKTALEELEQLNIQPNEDAQIAEVLEKLTNLESLRSAAGYAHEAISSENYDAQDALSQIGAAKKALEQVASHDAELARISSEIAAVNSTLADLAGDLSRYLGNLEQDAEISLEQAQQRKAEISAALRRYGPELDDLLVFQDSAVKELAELSISDDELIDLEQKIVILHQSVLEMSNELTANRQAASSELQEAVSQELRSLAMPGASLNVNIEPLAELGQHGADAVQLLLCAYPGAEPRPISKSASGGELSRIMLAIEVVLARNEQVPTFIFDEVDAGVGGAAAIEIGRRLARLATQAQVIVVTHLAQVAAFANHHLRITKTADGGFTNSSVSSLTEHERITELARMLSGLNESESARQHASELLGLARSEFGLI
jgi:DNA repair protein RecN (Recombination protein N)